MNLYVQDDHGLDLRETSEIDTRIADGHLVPALIPRIAAFAGVRIDLAS